MHERIHAYEEEDTCMSLTVGHKCLKSNGTLTSATLYFTWQERLNHTCQKRPN
jgi:hypothetical protein